MTPPSVQQRMECGGTQSIVLIYDEVEGQWAAYPTSETITARTEHVEGGDGPCEALEALLAAGAAAEGVAS